MRTLIWTSVVAVVMATGVTAHHGYAEYDRTALVTLEGTVTRVLWSNPHVVLTLETRSGVYAVEWASVTQLSRRGIASAPVKEGDAIVVTGSINRNPEKRIITLIQEIRRPADHWEWTSATRVKASS
jgi:hypothetical protein